MSASKLATTLVADTAYVNTIPFPRVEGTDSPPVEAWLRAAVNALNRALKSSMRLVVQSDASHGTLQVVDANAKPGAISHLTIAVQAARSVSASKLVVFMQYLVVTLGPLERARGRNGDLQSAWDATVGPNSKLEKEGSVTLHTPFKSITSLIQSSPVKPRTSHFNASPNKWPSLALHT